MSELAATKTKTKTKTTTTTTTTKRMKKRNLVFLWCFFSYLEGGGSSSTLPFLLLRDPGVSMARSSVPFGFCLLLMKF